MKEEMYLYLFHGRMNAGDDMDDWGEEGPMIGPVGISWTYGNIKVHTPDFDDFEFLQVVDDLVYFRGMYYGDFEIQSKPNGAPLVSAEEFIAEVKKFKQEQSKLQQDV